jgi:hypothetical protein
MWKHFLNGRGDLRAAAPRPEFLETDVPARADRQYLSLPRQRPVRETLPRVALEAGQTLPADRRYAIETAPAASILPTRSGW